MVRRIVLPALLALLSASVHAAPVDANFVCPDTVPWTVQTSTTYTFTAPPGSAVVNGASLNATASKTGQARFAGIASARAAAAGGGAPTIVLYCSYSVTDEAGRTAGVLMSLPYKQCVLAREGITPGAPVNGTDPKALALACADGPRTVLVPASSFPTQKPVVATAANPFICPAQFPYDAQQQRFRPDPASGLAILDPVPASSGVARFQGVNNVALPLNATSCLYIDNVSVRQPNGTYAGQAKVYAVRVPGNCRLNDAAAQANRQYFNQNPATLPIVCN